MTRRVLFGLVAVLWLTVAGVAQAQTTLRFKFKADEKLGYVLDQKLKMSTTVMGKDIDVTIQQNMDMAWQVGKVDGGVADLKITFAAVKISIDGPTGKVEIDSKNPGQQTDAIGKIVAQVVAAIAGVEMTCKIDETGEVKDVKVPDKVRETLKSLPAGEAMGDILSDEGLKKIVQGGFVVPKEPVAKGKSWKRKADMKVPMGKITGDIEFTYEGQDDKDGKKLEKIALKPNVTLEPDPNATTQIKFKGQQGKGTAYFDNEAGRLIEVVAQQTMEMSVEVANMTILQKIEQNTTLKLKK